MNIDDSSVNHHHLFIYCCLASPTNKENLKLTIVIIVDQYAEYFPDEIIICNM